jgi:hypothetical protein
VDIFASTAKKTINYKGEKDMETLNISEKILNDAWEQSKSTAQIITEEDVLQYVMKYNDFEHLPTSDTQYERYKFADGSELVFQPGAHFAALHT